MAGSLRDEQWRQVLELAQAVAELPKHERHAFLESADSSPEVIQQVLVLVNEFEAPDAPSIQVGGQIGHFLITGLLGRGGMGEVYSARDTELERTVALKFLHREATGLPDATNRMIREARTASALNHPNIVTIYEVMRVEPDVGIVMEYVEGLPLRHLHTERLPGDRLIDIAQQIAHALAAAHAAGIVHRDIKPENVILRSDGQVKVLDFGLARYVSAEHARSNWTSGPGLPAGTWRYMSPEQCRGETLTGASDVFSLGLVLYELSTGQHPFQANSAFETMQGMAGQEPVAPSRWNPQIPAGLGSLVLAMLAKEPARRPAAAEIARQLASLEREGHSSTSVPVRRADTGRYRRVWIAALLAVAAVSAAVYWILHRPDQPARLYQVTSLIPENHATAAAISPDGKFSTYANADGIFLRASESGETTALRAPADFVVDQMSWLADSTKLVASGFSTLTNRPSVWSVSITGSAPRLIRTEARAGVPSPDGNMIALISDDWSAVWVARVNGEEPRKIVSGPGDDTFLSVVWAADGRHLILQRRHYSGNRDLGFVMSDRFYERSLESIAAGTGRIVSKIADFWVQSAISLPNGSTLLLHLDRGSDHARELWEVKTDAATGAFLKPPRKIPSPLTEINEGYVGLSATADGKQLMVLRRTSENAVFVADYRANPPKFSHPRRLTLDARENYPHAWTADSKAVIFESKRSGNWDLFRQSVDQRTPETIIATPGRAEVLPQLALDGHAVLYAAGPYDGKSGGDTLMRVPIEGGAPEEVAIGGPLDQFRCAVGAHQPCVLRKTIERRYYVFYDLDPVRGIGRELARTAWLTGVVADWDISPDGSLVAIPNHDTRSAKIRVVRLHAEDAEPKEREIELAGLTDLSGLVWAADGSGWFVSLRTTIGYRMVYVYLNGRVESLGDVQGWAVPSPDGAHVAYLDRITAANAWIVDRR